MIQKNTLSKKEISDKISDLRLILSEAYEKNGHTDEVVKISQELDKYIVLAQGFFVGK
ncbi:aspartyl-phosphate phosphatase Spo0E family protein [Maledivibacter halophilus]|uniref:Spo0E like sporulation regulatory protein n=1 Tax=Maledivibacter halophilus TaxID=36842 RepID=A0A1T5K694_9FIRM|nr:aspartyl-phosphate phosphatase Spo0E family protein [Maledivibacter halophilus]SKC59262.1 Spo0E like sporulation regulatory protein [Maledivibacter halophilus]